ncbi:MAG: NUDIX domain-containing protein [Ilumatobacteraceae bacterium]
MSDPTAGLRIRNASRALLLDPDDRVLLVRFAFPTGVSVWAPPGGGVEPGETLEATLRRELIEEVGLDHADVGPLVWVRTHIIPFANGLFDGQRDHIHLVRTPSFEPRPRLTWEQLNSELVVELRWWDLAAIRAATDLRFVPGALAEHLAALLADGPPDEPIDVGV